MGFAFFLLLLAAVAFVSLKDMRPIAESSASTVFTGVDWLPVSIGGETVETDSKLSVRFEDNGKVSGYGGCNSFFSTYTVNDSSIEIGPIGATRMACPDPQMNREIRFFEALEGAKRIVTRGSRMRLSDAEDETLADFTSHSAEESS
jgi:heat shock protein HslJ